MFVILYLDLGVNLPLITSVTLAPFFPLHVFQEHWRFLQFIIPQHCWYCEGFFFLFYVSFFPQTKSHILDQMNTVVSCFKCGWMVKTQTQFHLITLPLGLNWARGEQAHHCKLFCVQPLKHLTCAMIHNYQPVRGGEEPLFFFFKPFQCGVSLF